LFSYILHSIGSSLHYSLHHFSHISCLIAIKASSLSFTDFTWHSTVAPYFYMQSLHPIFKTWSYHERHPQVLHPTYGTDHQATQLFPCLLHKILDHQNQALFPHSHSHHHHLLHQMISSLHPLKLWCPSESPSCIKPNVWHKLNRPLSRMGFLTQLNFK